MKTYSTISLGCKVNAYEISALTSRLQELGYKEDNVNPFELIKFQLYFLLLQVERLIL